MNETENRKRWRELAELYALGALDGSELQEFEGKLQEGNDLCLEYLREAEEVLTAMVQEMPRVEPPAELCEKIMSEIEHDAPVGAGAAGFNPFWAPAAGWALVAFVVLFGWNQTGAARHAREFERVEAGMMAAPSSQRVALTGLEGAQTAKARLLWDERGKCFFMTYGLPKNAQDKVYELWGLRGSEPVPAGLFKVDAHGCGYLDLKGFSPKDFDKFAVTLEPAGGVPKPTGPMVLLGASQP